MNHGQVEKIRHVIQILSHVFFISCLGDAYINYSKGI